MDSRRVAMGSRIDGHGVSIRHEESSEDFLEPSIVFVKDRDVAMIACKVSEATKSIFFVRPS